MAKKSQKPKLHTGDMEVILARRWNYRRNLIVPNVSWGLGFRYELDLLIVTPSKWATEIEIKVSLSDLKADKKTRHDHTSSKVKYLYFAVPVNLGDIALELIPERAGLVIVEPLADRNPRSAIVRPAKINKQARKLTEKEVKKLLELAAMRIWSLKEHLYRLKRKEVQRMM